MLGSEILQSKIADWAKIKGKKPAIVETHTNHLINYETLANAVFCIKNVLGNQPKILLLALPGGINDALIWLAALTGGHLMIPVSPNLTAYEYEQLLMQHTPDLLISDNELLHKLYTKETITSAAITDLLDRSDKQLPFSPAREGKVFLATSGSTGKPKGIVLSTTQMIITADNIRKSHKITEQDRGLTPLPFYHVNAPVVSLLTSILAGSELIIAPKYSTSHFWEWVKKYDPTWISLVPTMIAMLLTTDKPAFLKHASLRFIRTASAPLPKTNLEKFEKKFDIPLIETYGITEAAATITANPVPPGRHKPGSAGLPLGVSLRICKPQSDEVLNQGEIGEICVKGDNVISAYEQNAGKDSFSNGWFRTGDLGYIDKDGYVFLTGRIKDLIIRGGENIAPREIEEVLIQSPSVAEAVVVGQPDPIYGEKIVAFLILNQKNQKSNQATLEEIRDYAKKKLSPQKVPAAFSILAELPKTHTGKVDKNVLRQYNL